jgi:hypothetical protein
MPRSYSRECNSCSASQHFPRILGTSKIHYRIYISPPVFSVLNQMNPAQFLQDPSISRSSKRSPSFGFSIYLMYTGPYDSTFQIQWSFSALYDLRESPINSKPSVTFRNSSLTWGVAVPATQSLSAVGCETDLSPPSNWKVKNGGAIPPPAHSAFMAWCLIK